MIKDIIIKLPPSKFTEFTDSSNIIGYDIPEFTNDVFDLLTQYFQQTNEFPGLDINANAAYTDIRENNSIALRHKILKRKFGQFDSGRPSSSGLKNIKWTKIDEVEDPKYPGHKITIKKQMFDTVIEFGVWSKNIADANRFSYKLEDIFDQYSIVFSKKGLQELRFLERGEDEYKEVGGTNWYLIPMRYLVRTYKLKREFSRILNQVVISTEIYK